MGRMIFCPYDKIEFRASRNPFLLVLNIGNGFPTSHE
jgi:hypothetical protein